MQDCEAYQPSIQDGRGIFPEDFRIKAPRGFNDAVRAAAGHMQPLCCRGMIQVALSGETLNSQADNTAPKQLEAFCFKRGQSGNPAGRPKGSRNKLSEEFVAELYADWCEHGATALKTVRESRPDVYVKVVASLLPRKIEAKVSEITHEERVAERERRIAQYQARHGPVSEALN
jgi:hypothetical protein